MPQGKKLVWEAGAFVVTVGSALILAGALLAVTGNDPVQAYRTLLLGAFGSANRVAETLVKACPLAIMGLGIAIAFRAQVWNIGGDGQFTLGAIASTFVALNLPLPAVVRAPFCFLAAFAGGAAWGGLVGYLRARFRANEVITTLMFNYLATYLLQYLIRGPMIDPEGGGFPQTPLVDPALRLPILLTGTRLHAGLIVALVLLLGGLLFWRSTLGFSIRLVGESREVARYSGLNVDRTIVTTMLISGGLCGLAGWTEVFGIHYRLLDDICPGYGSLAIVVALLGNLAPLGVLVSSFFFAALLVGAATMQRLAGTPFVFVHIVVALVVMFAISRVMLERRGRRRARVGIRRAGVPDWPL